jgi:hypothetical protein
MVVVERARGVYLVVTRKTRDVVFGPFNSNPDPRLVAKSIATQLNRVIWLQRESDEKLVRVSPSRGRAKHSYHFKEVERWAL